MTREEALKVLDTIPTIGEQVDALEMAIEELEQKTCKDCISRDEAKLGRWLEKSVSHERPTFDGWQSAKCSNCGLYHTTPYAYYFNDFKFCPNCGKQMKP